MKLSCLQCGREYSVQAKTKHSIICPNCNGYAVSQPLQGALAQQAEHITQEKIEDVIKNEAKLLEVAEKKLKWAGYYIPIFLKILKSPTVPFTSKAIAAASLLYVISPIDLIPDPIPVVGFGDDIAVVLLAVYLLGTPLINSLRDRRQNDDGPELKPVIYSIVGRGVPLRYNYYESRTTRFWHIRVDEVDTLGLKMHGGGFIQPNMCYVRHPYFSKVLLPYDRHEEAILEDMLKEELGIYKALGASTIEIKTESYHYDGTKFKSKLQAQKLVNANANLEKHGIRKSVDTRRVATAAFTDVDYDYFTKLVWYLMPERSRDDVIRDRLFNFAESISVTRTNSTENILKGDLKLKSAKIGGVQLNLERTHVAMMTVQYDVHFHPFPEHMVAAMPQIRERVKSIVDERRVLIGVDIG